ncbi:MAG: hypothetical protein AAGB31_11970, partial [Bdellovibrio sp.]
LITELAADEVAVEKCGAQPQQLFVALIEIAEAWSGSSGKLMHTYASGGFHQLKARAQSLLEHRREKKNWLFILVATASVTTCGFLSLTQARAAMTEKVSSLAKGENMCMQVKHEKIIETWLQIEPSIEQNKCEVE